MLVLKVVVVKQVLHIFMHFFVNMCVSATLRYHIIDCMAQIQSHYTDI